MTNLNQSNGKQTISAKEKQLLDLALEGKSDTFKFKVYQIVHTLKMDASDPAFLMLIGTGRLEVLLDEFPEQFDLVFKQALNRLQQVYKESELRLDRQFNDLRGIAQGIKVAGDDLKESLNIQVQEVLEGCQELTTDLQNGQNSFRQDMTSHREALKSDWKLNQVVLENVSAEYRAVNDSTQKTIAENRAIVAELRELQDELRKTRFWGNILDSLPPLVLLGTIVGGVVVGVAGTCFYFGENLPYLQFIHTNQAAYSQCISPDGKLNPEVTCYVMSKPKVKNKKGK